MYVWNKAAEEILGHKADEVIGKMNIKKIYPEGMAKEVMKMMMRSPEYGGKKTIELSSASLRNWNNGILGPK